MMYPATTVERVVTNLMGAASRSPRDAKRRRPVNCTVSHFGICVSDLAGALRFYCEGLGFEDQGGIELVDTCGNVMDLENFELHTRFLALGNTRIELLHYVRSEEPVCADRLRRMNQTGLTHMALSVPDIDAAASRLVAHGGKIFPETRATLNTPEGTIELMYGCDPDFTRIELIRYPR